MKNVYTVGQINTYIKNMFVQDYLLKRLYVKGEVSNLKYHSSGHIYFSLKDETGTLSCVMFAGQRKGLAFHMENGQQVIVLGTVSVYERDGKYQLYANEIILDGAGLLYEKFEALKKELLEMGMFDPSYKQPIPSYVKRLGIVTASTGAAVRDIINISKRRNPFVQLILYPAKVQGEGAAQSIVKGIKTLDAYGVDAMIVGRGGGSIEDLWAFNEEAVARAIFECRTPVISAVGHETDTTIADYVADLRAPTPSAAAELAVADVREIFGKLESYRLSIRQLMEKNLDYARGCCQQYRLALAAKSPESLIRDKRQLALNDEMLLEQLMKEKLTEAKNQLGIYAERLNGLSPLKKLSQGYAYVMSEKRERISSVEQVKKGEKLSLYLADGEIEAKVEDSRKLSHA
ncbi:MAG TPA: exodeoxyribonuclease VII large subunit [Candidatus Limivivens merdigallinarum]|uniref:Exodeoxyribonuclease 7 large subunit n=1 Tax=Candidatus Limivivens merdigallinarum TaxID=2840859 RepID=A0A9D0ZYQ8_9FIRM|nr:exodeoxyribonuclease VII large subunit [Candidatus Limivivens merdigallinarum]